MQFNPYRLPGVPVSIARVLFGALLFLIPIAGMHAQSGAGAIQGTIQDSTGAIIPGAVIHVLNDKTGVTDDTKANGSGFYSLPSLFAGSYTLTIDAPGMKNYQVHITLDVGQTTVISPKLTPGNVTETVTVESGTQRANYENPTISSTLDSNRIDQLPENGRNILTLIQETTPGVEANGTRVNGNENAGVEYVQDGAPLANRNSGGPTTQPDPDSVQEVRLETSNSNAQFATPATAILTTKSGTNSIHGSVFETARNNYIGVAKSRSDPFNLVAPHLVRNEFGGSVGGPIVIPKLYNGRDRSFFFVAFERYSSAQIINYLDTVPTVAMRNGDFSGLTNSAGTPQTIFDPSTSNPTTAQRTPFNYQGSPSCTYNPTTNVVANCSNKIDPARISPLASALYAITPLPTNGQNPALGSNYTDPGRSFNVTPTVTARVDQILNPNNRLYIRYTDSLRSNLGLRSATTPTLPGTLPSDLLGVQPTNYQSTPIIVYSGAIGFTHVFSPTLVSVTTLGNQWENDNVEGGGNTNTNYEQILGLPNNFGEVGFPQIGSTNLFTYYQGSQYNYDGSQIVTNLDEDLTKTAGRHQIFFGFRYRHEKLGVLPDRNPDSLSFNGYGTGDYQPSSGANYTTEPNAGNANADFFLGAVQTYSITLNPPYLHYHDAEYDSYIQDDFHVNSKLTLNFGLRWEAHPAAVEDNNSVNGFDLANHAVVLGEPIPQLIARGVTTQALITNLQNLGVSFETPQQAGLPPHLVNSYDAIFQPRLGFAYSPFKGGAGTVIRGGFGRYTYPIPLRNFYSIVRQNAPTSVSYSQSYTNANQVPDNLPNYLLRKPLPPAAGLYPTGIINTGTTTSILPGGFSETTLNPRYPPNLVTQFNTTIEQPIFKNYIFRVTYGYNAGANLDQLNYHNQAESSYVWETTTGTIPPTGTYASVALQPYDNHTYGVVTTDDRIGFSNDNYMQMNFQRQYKKDFGFQVFWTYSRAFRVGGNTFRDSQIYPYQDFAPGVAPTQDPEYLNRFENYILDSAIPEHHIGFNGIYNLPVGRGKRFLGRSNRFVDELVGGYEVAFDGAVTSSYFQPYNSNWGPTNPIQTYKKQYPITDCNSGTCLKGYLWFNGFISPQLQQGITGLPSSYTQASQPAYQQPINVINTTNPTTGKIATSTNNNVSVKLNTGSSVTVAYSPGPAAQGANPFSHTFIHGPWNYAPDISIFKVFPVKEGMFFRINVDAFNVFNIQGMLTPTSTTNGSTTGELLLTGSNNTPRQLQFTGRFTF